MSINPKTNSVAERQKLKVAHLIVFFFSCIFEYNSGLQLYCWMVTQILNAHKYTRDNSSHSEFASGKISKSIASEIWYSCY